MKLNHWLHPIVLLALLGAPVISVAGTPVTQADYRAAARFTPEKISKMLFSTAVQPHWLPDSEQFWYQYDTSEGTFYYLVNPAKRTKWPLFDNADMAARLSAITRNAYDAKHLPIEKLAFIGDDRLIRFEIGGAHHGNANKDAQKANGDGENAAKENGDQAEVFVVTYDILSGKLTHLKNAKPTAEQPAWASLSPDGEKVVFVRQYDLYWMDRANYEKALQDEEDDSIVEHRLTTDGVEHYTYSGNANEQWHSNETEEDRNKRQKATLSWSRDASKFALVRFDKRKVKPLWVINALTEPRPALTRYRYPMPGEEQVPQSELWVFDIAGQTKVKIETEGFIDQTLLLMEQPGLRFKLDERDVAQQQKAQANQTPQWIADTADKLYYYRVSRDYKKADLMVADTATGKSRVLIEERSHVYTYFYRFAGVPFRLIGNGKEMIAWSERSGWAQLYLYGGDGTLKNAITSGAYHVSEILGVDEGKRQVYFVANGREKGEDPLYQHLYRVNFDGSGLKLLNPGNNDSFVALSKSNRYFVNNFSRVDTTPQSELRDNQGNVLMALETADLSLLLAAGFQFPKPFKVKADDSLTDIYGAMYKPFKLDPDKEYPIIAYVYPGPQGNQVPHAFDLSFRKHMIMLAQFGHVVITVGNRGGHLRRSNWYQTYSMGHFRDYGLADVKAAIEQLANRHSFINLDKVGIYGDSGGGFMSTAAMLVYPDFFKVGVSNFGNHENNIYNNTWSELHHGVNEVVDEEGHTRFEIDVPTNSELAANLKGRLLLATGDIDSNVHPAQTYRVVHALIEANKRFDFFLVPGQGHVYTGHDKAYFNWIRADYFNKHLIGDSATSVDLVELSRDIPMTGGDQSLTR